MAANGSLLPGVVESASDAIGRKKVVTGADPRTILLATPSYSPCVGTSQLTCFPPTGSPIWQTLNTRNLPYSIRYLATWVRRSPEKYRIPQVFRPGASLESGATQVVNVL